MSQLRIKEYPTGKLYISDELLKTHTLTLNDLKGNQMTVILGEAINLCKFSKRGERNLNNQIAFLSSCKSAGILPKVCIYELRANPPDSEAQHILIISGTYDDQIKYQEMFYLPKAESIFDNLFHSQDWSQINPESSVGNIAMKGYGLSSLDSFDALLRKIRNGDYVVSRTV